MIRRLGRVVPAFWVAEFFRSPEFDLKNMLFLEDGTHGTGKLWFVNAVIHLYMLYPMIYTILEIAGAKRSLTSALVTAALGYAALLCITTHLVATHGGGLVFTCSD